MTQVSFHFSSESTRPPTFAQISGRFKHSAGALAMWYASGLLRVMLAALDANKKCRSRMIHPVSPFMMCVNLLSAVLNLYCFFELPVIIAFFWNAESCFRPPVRTLSCF